MEHGQLVTKGENLSLQDGVGPKTGGEKSEESNQNIVHRGCNHHLTNDGNLCIFKSAGVFRYAQSIVRIPQSSLIKYDRIVRFSEARDHRC